ncbi:hypothetical protein [Streptomyces sp. NPDC007083]|uniref:hypothetical protein n=1 Tax=Streptomyces sp. NPDC007083 TaxID=3156913 RepID=UPI0033C8216A
MTTALPELWIDWCTVTATPLERRDKQTLGRFVRQAGPSRHVLSALRRGTDDRTAVAPVWPAEHRDNPAALNGLVKHGTVLIEDRGTHWLVRLRLRRLLFAAVLLAPTSQGGLGLTRRQALDLTPGDLQSLRRRIGTAPDPASCPACIVWSWLEVIGMNNGWSHRAVRSLAHHRDAPADGEHRHQRRDASPDWHDCPGVLPAIDRWGYVDPYASMHPSSLSVLVRTMGTLLEEPTPTPAPPPEPASARMARRITPEEEERIFARADELNARITKLLLELG